MGDGFAVVEGASAPSFFGGYKVKTVYPQQNMLINGTCAPINEAIEVSNRDADFLLTSGRATAEAIEKAKKRGRPPKQADAD